jgi:hypothetical protein
MMAKRGGRLLPGRKGTLSNIRLPAVLPVGFTGHRRLPDETASRAVLRGFLREYKASTPAIVYGVSSSAAGADLLFAETCLELDIPLRILLPMPAEEFRNDFDAESWARAERVLARAISVEVTGERGERGELYYECGIRTVQQCRLLVALWDGQEARGLGGTAEVVEFADKIGRPVVCFHSRTGARHDLHADAMAGLLDDQELEFLNGLPDAGVPPPSGLGLRLARAWFDKIDANAGHFAPRSRKLAAVPVTWTAAGALFSGFASRAPAATFWMGLSAAMGIIAAVLPSILRLDHWQRLWARTRTAAEVCRSMMALWPTPGDYDLIGPEAIPELGGVLLSLNFLHSNDTGRAAISLDEFRRQYREERLQGQINYFHGKSADSEREGRHFRLLTWISAGLALLVAAWWFSGRFDPAGFHHHGGGRWIPLLISALFQVATVAGAMVVIRDCDRRQRRFRELEQWLINWEPQFDALRTLNSVLEIATRIERALLVELLEWRSLMRHAKLPRK